MRVPFQDEGRFGRIGDALCGWVPLPLRPAVGSQIVRDFGYAYAAVCPAHGQIAWLILPWDDARLMSLFLGHTTASFPAITASSFSMARAGTPHRS